MQAGQELVSASEVSLVMPAGTGAGIAVADRYRGVHADQPAQLHYSGGTGRSIRI